MRKWIPIEAAGEFPHSSGVVQVVDDKAIDAILSQEIPEGGLLLDFDHYSSLTQEEREALREMGFAVGDEFGQAADAGGEYGPHPGHGFHDAEGLVFHARALDEDMGSRKKLGGGHPAGQLHAVAQTPAGDLSLEGAAQGAVAGDEDSPGAGRGIQVAGESPHGAEEEAVIFFGAQAAEHPEGEDAAGGIPQFLRGGTTDDAGGAEAGGDVRQLERGEAAAAQIAFVKTAQDNHARKLAQGPDIQRLEKAFLELPAEQPAVDGADDGEQAGAAGGQQGVPVGFVAGGMQHGAMLLRHEGADLRDGGAREAAGHRDGVHGGHLAQGCGERTAPLAQPRFLQQQDHGRGHAGGVQAGQQLDRGLLRAVEAAGVLQQIRNFHRPHFSESSGQAQTPAAARGGKIMRKTPCLRVGLSLHSAASFACAEPEAKFSGGPPPGTKADFPAPKKAGTSH